MKIGETDIKSKKQYFCTQFNVLKLPSRVHILSTAVSFKVFFYVLENRAFHIVKTLQREEIFLFISRMETVSHFNSHTCIHSTDQNAVSFLKLNDGTLCFEDLTVL
jgi:hypothetical protein